MGGVSALTDEMAVLRELRLRMAREHARLVEQYPNKWVAMGKNGLIAVRDSCHEAFDAVECRGLRRSDAVVEFMDTKPPVLVLTYSTF